MVEEEGSPARDDSLITHEELQLATRNHGMPLEALRYEITPIGLHYLLTHYDIPFVDPDEWKLLVSGRVRRELALSLEDLRARPVTTKPVTMECAGNGRARLAPRPISQPWLLEAVSTAEWSGTLLKPILEEAGLRDDAVEVVFTGADRGVDGGVEQDYQRGLPVEDALRDDVLLAYEINGQPLPPQHGFPLRLIVPGWYGMAQVKWLRQIEAVSKPFEGYQNVQRYRVRQEENELGEALTRMLPRSLMVPPGIPEFLSRSRVSALGPCLLGGRAWSGAAPIAKVEVSVDGGNTWAEADVGAPPGDTAWYPWAFRWEPTEPGPYVLCCRATDALGGTQPVESPWNLLGYANNAVQRIDVMVTR